MRCPVAGIQIARGLVREQHGRMRHESARDRDALLLAAGQLLRIMRDARRQPHLLQRAARAAWRASRRPPSSSGNMTFSIAVSEGIR